MIIYVTGRPDMQKHRVVAWLSQHNFPHGAVSFCDGLTHDPLRQKAAFLQSLRTEVAVRELLGHGAGDRVVGAVLNPGGDAGSWTALPWQSWKLLRAAPSHPS